ncbi:chemotaxis protein CheW [Desulfurivibrio alkaliphilus]|uniref:Response regulator receiver modulated CheW protein n=1 Tax=Desulfurivibrio alkaliphilus (strain DSM 19089 / UNIQEM U267 / AHT2) TaxID=589865 RepID=D6Z0T9_DESAT|nr:chemotaxis protein CheW [Desulfurivibrio alkaliphilus]ADH87199.1 response regulator receiver modulated CheW protein [Desulfurivibrio alkaliphilus AHT 2]
MAIDPNIKILLVEDAGTMRKMEAKILGQVGFNNIVEAVDGQDAVEKLQADQDIGLVISDWSMPNMDGLELVQWLRSQEQLKDIPFLMATGHGDKEYVAKALEGGASGVVAKPFTPPELKSAMEKAFGLEQEEVPKVDEGPKVSSEGKVNLKMAHIQITDHLALGVLKHWIDTGRETPAHFTLETKCMGSWNPVQGALESFEVDGAFILAPAAMDLFSYDVPLKLVLFAHRNGSICVRNRQGKYIKPYQQFFKHKTFYIPHKMSIHNMLAHMYFTQMGLKPGVAGKEAVNVLFDVAPPVAMPQFLKDNPEASGFLVAEPIGSRAIAAGIAEKQFLSSEIWDHHPCCVVVFRDEIIAQYPEAVQEFTDLVVKAGKSIKEDIDRSAQIAVDFLDPEKSIGLEPALLKNVLSDPAGIVYHDLYPVKEDLETIQDYMVNRMEIGRTIDLDAFIETRFASKACGQGGARPAGGENGQRSGALKMEEFKEKQQLSSREGKYLVFSLGSERYGIGILDVKEIIGLMDIHELPHMPSFFKGVINLRDRVIPVMDLRLKFGMEEAAYNERTCIIIVEISGVRGSTLTGIIVDSVSEVVNVKDNQVEDAPSFGTGVDQHMILGMAKLKEGVTILLDIDRLMHTQEVVALGAVEEMF